VRAFVCGVCGQLLFFENSQCLRCSSTLGFVPERLDLAVIERSAYRGGPASGEAGDRRAASGGGGGGDPGAASGEEPGRRCVNASLAGCNWLLAPDDPEALCRSCRLTRTRPRDGDTAGLRAFARAEGAKRRLLFELFDLGLPVAGGDLRFDLLSSALAPVVTGHQDGLITIDLAESDDVRREQRRAELGEPYRTMLGHFRHEIAHYYWPILIEEAGPDELQRCRALFGDEREDYADAQQRHYNDGPPADWAERHVSAYATMHPWEDWAETFAHFLHIRDTLQTAAAFGIVVSGPDPIADPSLIAVPEIDAGSRSIAGLIASWLPLTYALNAVNRSMGHDDLYPFTLAPTVIEKLGYVHRLIPGA